VNKELLKLKMKFIENNISFEKKYIDEEELKELREIYGHIDNVPDIRFDYTTKTFYRIDSNVLTDDELNQFLMLKLNEKIVSDIDKQKKFDELLDINKKMLSAKYTLDEKINTMKNIMIFWVVLTIISLMSSLYVAYKIASVFGHAVSY